MISSLELLLLLLLLHLVLVLGKQRVLLKFPQ